MQKIRGRGSVAFCWLEGGVTPARNSAFFQGPGFISHQRFKHRETETERGRTFDRLLRQQFHSLTCRFGSVPEAYRKGCAARPTLYSFARWFSAHRKLLLYSSSPSPPRKR